VRAVTFQEPGRVAIEERPDPELLAPDDAVVRVEASGICGSDLHIYHGRIQIEPGFTIGHEYVGTVVAAGDGVTGVSEGDRVLGTFHTACGMCFFCRHGIYQQCDQARVFGHGATLGSLQGTQAELALVPRANMTLRRVPERLSDAAALFAGDVMGTAYHAIVAAGLRPGDTCAVVGLGPVGLCAAMVALAAGASRVIAVDTVPERLDTARGLGAHPVHATEENPRDAVKSLTEFGGVDVAVDAVGHPGALDTAIRLARKGGTVSVIGVYAERAEVHMGVFWIKGLNMISGRANVIAHLDSVLAMLGTGRLDVSPLVSREMKLEDAAEAYEAYDRREALKIVLRA
jgi:2-desacetyl-2-hydroxyethyl bacteriochlorophyllide A dehydrogenase